MNPTSLERLLHLRDASAVTRYHTARTLRMQSLAEHSYGVALIILHLDPGATARLLAAALYHDLSEISTGDIPAPVKWDSRELTVVLSMLETRYARRMGLDMDLGEAEAKMLKWADMFELVLWCREEWRMGNAFAHAIMTRGINYLLHDLGPCTPEAAQLLFNLMEDVK